MHRLWPDVSSFRIYLRNLVHQSRMMSKGSGAARRVETESQEANGKNVNTGGPLPNSSTLWRARPVGSLQPVGRPPSECHRAATLILNFPASRIISDNFLVFTSYPSGIFFGYRGLNRIRYHLNVHWQWTWRRLSRVRLFGTPWTV